MRVQQQLDAQQSLAMRNRQGQFSTPPELALQMVVLAQSMLPPDGRVRFVEPSLGTGVFYSALERQLGRARIGRAVGFELDTRIAEAAERVWKDTPLRVCGADFLRLVPPSEPQFDLLLANPPYVRHQHLSSDYKNVLRSISRLARFHISGLASLYTYFMLAADAWLVPGGVALWLVPHEFLDVNYGSCLRGYLASEVDLLRVHRFPFAGSQFPEALVTSCVVAYRKRRSGAPAEASCVFSTGDALETVPALEPAPAPATAGARATALVMETAAAPAAAPVLETAGATANAAAVAWQVVGPPASRPSLWMLRSTASLRAFERWGGLFEPDPAERRQLGDASEMVIGELFEIRRGIATGANDFFILDREAARERGVPECCVRPILPSPRSLESGVIETDRSGYPRLSLQKCVLDCTLPLPEIESRWPSLAAYLSHGVDRGIDQRYLPRHRRPWYSQERRDPAPFLCSYMGRPRAGREPRPLRFFWNRSRAIAPNVYLMLYPKVALRILLDREPELWDALFAALNEIPFQVMARHGRVYGGGLYKLEPRELARLPLTGLHQLRDAVPADTAQRDSGRLS